MNAQPGVNVLLRKKTFSSFYLFILLLAASLNVDVDLLPLWPLGAEVVAAEAVGGRDEVKGVDDGGTADLSEAGNRPDEGGGGRIGFVGLEQSKLL